MSAELKVLAPRDGRTTRSTLDMAAECDLAECLVIGTTASGELVFLNSGVSLRDALWLVECARNNIMRDSGA